MTRAALAVTALTWPPTHRCHHHPRWACAVLAVLADDHTATAHAHQQLTGLRAELARLPAGELAARLDAIVHTAITPTDDLWLHHQLRQHGHSGAIASLRQAQHHRRDALQTLRRTADLARCGHTRTAHAHLTQTLADLDAAGAAIADADHTLIHQLHETISYSQQPQPPTHPQPTWGKSVSNTGEFRRASSAMRGARAGFEGSGSL